jgi:hypothetical protein
MLEVASIFAIFAQNSVYLKSQFSKSFLKVQFPKEKHQFQVYSIARKKIIVHSYNTIKSFTVSLRFSNWHLIRVYTCNKKISSVSFSQDLFSPCLRWVCPKSAQFAFPQLCSNAHAQSPATFYWLKRLAWSLVQVLVQPLLESSGEKIGGLLAACIFFLLSPAAQKRTMNFLSPF